VATLGLMMHPPPPTDATPRANAANVARTDVPPSAHAKDVTAAACTCARYTGIASISPRSDHGGGASVRSRIPFLFAPIRSPTLLSLPTTRFRHSITLNVAARLRSLMCSMQPMSEQTVEPALADHRPRWLRCAAGSATRQVADERSCPSEGRPGRPALIAPVNTSPPNPRRKLIVIDALAGIVATHGHLPGLCVEEGIREHGSIWRQAATAIAHSQGFRTRPSVHWKGLLAPAVRAACMEVLAAKELVTVPE